MSKQHYLQLNILVMKLCSLYPCNSNANLLEKIADFTYKFINVITMYLVVIPCIYEITLGGRTGGVTAYALHIVNTCIYVCTILTLHFFHARGYVARDLVTEMNDTFKFECDGESKECDMTRNGKVTRNITMGFSSLTVAAVVTMILLAPFIQFQEKMLPVPGVFPFKYKETPYYQMVYVLQSYTQFIMGALTGAGDSFFISMVLTSAAQFKVLAHDFHNCIYNTLLDCNVSKKAVEHFRTTYKNPELFLSGASPVKNIEKILSGIGPDGTVNNNLIFEVLNSAHFKIKLNKLFISYIEHHQKLLGFCVKMERFFLPFILMKTATSMFYNIFINFALLTSSDASLAFTLAQYELCALTEIFIYAIAGQALITESEQLREMVYSSPWYVCNKDYKFLVFMVLMRSGRAVRVSVGKLYDMSLPTFLMIMKTALSYLAVLRQVSN